MDFPDVVRDVVAATQDFGVDDWSVTVTGPRYTGPLRMSFTLAGNDVVIDDLGNGRATVEINSSPQAAPYAEVVYNLGYRIEGLLGDIVARVKAARG